MAPSTVRRRSECRERRPTAPGPSTRRASETRLDVDDARALILAARDDRFGAAVALPFVHGWRVSEVLGLVWEDLDFTAGTAMVRRAAGYVDGEGTVLGETKTVGAHGVHHLAPGVLAALRARRAMQQVERLAAPEWSDHTDDGRPISLVFTTLRSDVVGREAMVRLHGSEGIDLADVVSHVGHTLPATTAGYVRDLGQRPQRTHKLSPAGWMFRFAEPQGELPLISCGAPHCDLEPSVAIWDSLASWRPRGNFCAPSSV